MIINRGDASEPEETENTKKCQAIVDYKVVFTVDVTQDEINHTELSMYRDKLPCAEKCQKSSEQYSRFFRGAEVWGVPFDGNWNKPGLCCCQNQKWTVPCHKKTCNDDLCQFHNKDLHRGKALPVDSCDSDGAWKYLEQTCNAQGLTFGCIYNTKDANPNETKNTGCGCCMAQFK